MYIDTHVHLNSDDLFKDVEHYIEKARQEKVEKMIVIGFDDITNTRALSLAKSHNFIFASQGFHPTEAKNITDEDLSNLEGLLKHKEVKAIGECGLDFYWDKDNIDQQVHVFEAQIKLSKQYDLPLVIHMRDASEKTFEVIEKHAPLKGVMHCYSGSAEMAERFLSLGLHISLGGPVTFKNAKVPKEVAKMVPSDRLMIETDAPFLAPHPYRGKQNDSSYLPLIAKQIATLRDEPLEAVAKVTTNNAEKLFRI